MERDRPCDHPIRSNLRRKRESGRIGNQSRMTLIASDERIRCLLVNQIITNPQSSGDSRGSGRVSLADAVVSRPRSPVKYFWPYAVLQNWSSSFPNPFVYMGGTKDCVLYRDSPRKPGHAKRRVLPNAKLTRNFVLHLDHHDINTKQHITPNRPRRNYLIPRRHHHHPQPRQRKAHNGRIARRPPGLPEPRAGDSRGRCFHRAVYS